MLKHRHIKILFLASAILLTYTNNIYAKDCFTGVEAKQIELELKDSWWSSKEQQKLDINYNSSYLIPGRAGGCIVLIESRKKNSTCHACYVELGIATYSKSGNKWEKTFEQKKVGTLGDFGKLPESTLVKVGQNNYGVMFHHTSMHQGHFNTSDTLIAKVNDRYERLIGITTRAGYSERPNDFQAQYEFMKGENNQFFDIKVVSKKMNENWKDGIMEISTVTKTTIFKLVNDKYEIIEEKSDIKTHTREESVEDFIEMVQQPFVPFNPKGIKGEPDAYFRIGGKLLPEDKPRLYFWVFWDNSYGAASIHLEKVSFRFIEGFGEPKIRIIVGKVNEKCIFSYKKYNMIGLISEEGCVKGIDIQVEPKDIVPELTNWND